MQYDHIIIDGRHALFRVASTMASLGVDDLDGFTPTGPMYGFIKVCLSIVERHGHAGTRLTICWEGGWLHRRKMYPDYKRNRVKRKDVAASPLLITLNDQEAILKGILSLAGWEQAWCEGYEADDVMATLAAGARTPTAIYTGDHDLHQCVTDYVHVLSPNNTRKRKGGGDTIRWDNAAVRERWKVDPLRVPDVKGLEGDTSDNIPGCPGIGKVWAQKLLTEYGTVEDVIAAARSGHALNGTWDGKPWTSQRHASIIQDNVETIEMSKRLATVERQVPYRTITPINDSSALVDAFKTFHFATLLRPSVLSAIKALKCRGETPCP